MSNAEKKTEDIILEEGSKAPDFTLPTDTDGEITLSKLKGQKVVLYFYPKDNTPGCTTQACEFTEQLPNFEKVDATVIGISKDSVSSHDKFKEKKDLKIILASDENSDVCERYNAWQEKNMYGKKYMGIVRSTFLIDEDGIIQKIWPKVKVKGHVDEVLEATKSL